MKIAMYWHNGRSLGHTAEVAKISTALALDDELAGSLSLAGVSGATEGMDLLPAKMDLVKLPSFSKFETPQGLVFESKLSLTEGDFFACRSQLIDRFLRSYNPDIEVVNHNPRGLQAEFLASSNGRAATPRILSLRGVIYSREATYHSYFRPERAAYIIENYDRIVLHTDQEVFDFSEYYDVPDEINSMVTYAGYLSAKHALGKDEARAHLGFGVDERILMCSMAGGQGSIKIIHNFLRNAQELRSEFDRCVLLPGPYLEKRHFEALADAAKDNDWLEVHRYVADMRNWMAAADVFVGAAGANMISEVLSTGIHALMIPRQRFEAEQEIHSSFIQARGLISKLSLDEAETANYTELLLACQDKNKDRRHAVQLDGARAYCRIVKELTDGW